MDFIHYCAVQYRCAQGANYATKIIAFANAEVKRFKTALELEILFQLENTMNRLKVHFQLQSMLWMCISVCTLLVCHR